ncbi:type II toxin-antitoxin system VapC family toxin [Desulfatiferula olefinivorans]
MKILVDTHIFLWMLSTPEKLTEKRQYAINSPDNDIFLSALSIAELMIKQSIGKITISFNPLKMALETGLDILDFSGQNAITLGSLPLHHKDPFDRMLIAQAIDHGLALMSDDEKIKHYPCNII